MFRKSSRYARLEDVTVTDAKAGTGQAKPIRFLPVQGETFPYTVTGTDRLDHLGYRAFKKSEQWWRICDANPAFLHPQDIIGQSSRRECLISLPINDDSVLPNWNELLRAVRRLLGVEEAEIEESVALQSSKGPDVKEPEYHVEERFSAAIRIIYNALAADEQKLAEEIEKFLGKDIPAADRESVGRTGKEIAIPAGRVKNV